MNLRRAAAEDWIRSLVTPVGPIEVAHERPWSTVLRVPLRNGPAWFKACGDVQAFEPTLTARLFARWPGLLPEVLGHTPVRSRNSGSRCAPGGSSYPWKSAQAIPAHDCARGQRRHRGWPRDLALHDARLVADDRKLRPEARVRPVANDGRIEEQTDDGIEESERDCRRFWQVGPSSLRRVHAGTVGSFVTAQASSTSRTAPHKSGEAARTNGTPRCGQARLGLTGHGPKRTFRL